MTDRREGLALLAGEVVVVALALVLVAARTTVEPVSLAGVVLPPIVLGASLVVAGAALGAVRTADHVDARAAVGELGLGVAVALALTTADAVGLAAAVALALASARLRVDPAQLHAVLDR